MAEIVIKCMKLLINGIFSWTAAVCKEKIVLGFGRSGDISSFIDKGIDDKIYVIRDLNLRIR
ncbi:hypothetical protein [Natronoflexus pectinivorans]|uniref:Uncharacterized protein n=1 Tax=Natronoflexus pectinivorans TaxID=682526 RepID=A0A4R2GKV5_9BACT|nr:hypothetical protein [Natronoflexus pectinivorans]TCO08866.1 hypothetical protein EV194_104177 [Natronoflexus pectinivorans]